MNRVTLVAAIIGQAQVMRLPTCKGHYPMWEAADNREATQQDTRTCWLVFGSLDSDAENTSVVSCTACLLLQCPPWEEKARQRGSGPSYADSCGHHFQTAGMSC